MIFYIIGVVVVIAVVASYLGLHFKKASRRVVLVPVFRIEPVSEICRRR
jgi:hypothetical protein